MLIELWLLFSQVTIYRIECNIKFGRIKLLGSKAINESKHAKGNNTPSTTTEQHPANAQQANDGKVRIYEVTHMLFISTMINCITHPELCYIVHV